MVELSVIIPTYNRARVLHFCLEALKAQTVPRQTFEVVVVDDGSTDPTAEVVRRHQAALPLRYVRIPHSGACVARNAGIRESRGRVLLFIDSDSLASPQLLAEHLRYHRRWPNVVVTGPALLTHSPRPVRRPLLPWDISTSPFAAGNASVRRVHAIEVGMFDEGFVELGWEDVEFGLRLKKLGLKVRFNPRAVVYHYKSWDVDPTELVRSAEKQARMAVRFYRKHPCTEVAMATGLNPVALGLDRLASLANWNLRLARWLLEVGRRQRWPLLVRFAARQLYNRNYFQSLRRALAESPPSPS